MKKVYIYTHDPMLTMFYTEKETLDLFGDTEDMIELPEKLHDDFIKAKKEFYDQVKNLEVFLKKSGA